MFARRDFIRATAESKATLHGYANNYHQRPCGDGGTRDYTGGVWRRCRSKIANAERGTRDGCELIFLRLLDDPYSPLTVSCTIPKELFRSAVQIAKALCRDSAIPGSWRSEVNESVARNSCRLPRLSLSIRPIEKASWRERTIGVWIYCGRSLGQVRGGGCKAMSIAFEADRASCSSRNQ